jgi:hypothetical protein
LSLITNSQLLTNLRKITMPHRSRITVVETDYTPDESVPPLIPPTWTRKIPYSGPASDWSGEKTTFEEVEEEEEEEDKSHKDFRFIRERASGRERIIEHPAASNQNHNEYRFCHPNQSRARIMNATFGELKDTLNAWAPYGSGDECFKYHNVDFDEVEGRELLQKSLLMSEDIRNMVLIKSSAGDPHPHQDEFKMYKVIIFDKDKQMFLLRSIFYKVGLQEYYPKPLKNPSQHPEWYVDLSTLLASGEFWSELKVLINSM